MTSASAQTISLDDAFRTARRHQASGELVDAQRIYERILAQVPVHAESMVMLASVLYQNGENLQAEAYLNRAIGVYRQILEQQPDSLRARAPLANLLLARGKVEEAQAELAGIDLPLNPIRSTREDFERQRQKAVNAGRGSLILNTVPKSASESIWNRLAKGLGLAQCYLSIGLYPECTLVPSRMAVAAQGGIIAKEHLPATAHNLKLLQDHGLRRQIFHLRDPRQATLSWAHFVKDDVSSRLLAPIWRQVVPDAAVLAGGLEQVIDWSIDVYLPQLVAFVQGWIDVDADPAIEIDVEFLHFEDFISDSDAYVRAALHFLEIDPAVFDWAAEAQTVHLRRGETEEWRKAFSAAQQARAWNALPPAMVERFGWRK